MVAASLMLRVMIKDSTIVSMVPVTRQEMALAKLRECVSNPVSSRGSSQASVTKGGAATLRYIALRRESLSRPRFSSTG